MSESQSNLITAHSNSIVEHSSEHERIEQSHVLPAHIEEEAGQNVITPTLKEGTNPFWLRLWWGRDMWMWVKRRSQRNNRQINICDR